jgi:hypothetical protein
MIPAIELVGLAAEEIESSDIIASIGKKMV